MSYAKWNKEYDKKLICSGTYFELKKYS
jgi:hypothetical protein